MQPLYTTPSKPTLGVQHFGSYKNTPGDTKASDKMFAFDRVEDIWHGEVESDSEDEEETDKMPALTDYPESEEENEDEDMETDTLVQHSTKKRKAPLGVPAQQAGKKKLVPEPKPPGKKDPQLAINSKEEQTLKDDLTKLWRSIKYSKDRLFVVVHTPPGRSTASWYVVQVDKESFDSGEGKTTGKYHMKWWVPHHVDCKKLPIAKCRFWPEIHELKEGNFFGAIVPIRLHKIDVVLQNRQELEWYQLPIDLSKQTIHGPFDFEHVNEKGGARETPHPSRSVGEATGNRRVF